MDVYTFFLNVYIYEKWHILKNIKLNYVEIDPLKPVELLENIFIAVIGCASTGLISFGPNVYSIINFSGMSIDTINERKKHLICLCPDLHVQFPFTKNELIELIELIKK